MGNRAIININNVEIYLHWNGGVESVVAYLAYANEVGVRGDDYAPARLAQIIGNYMGGTLSLGVTPVGFYSSEDNGIYHVTGTEGGLKIVKHTKPFSDEEVEVDKITDTWPGFNEERCEEIIAELKRINDPIFKRES